MARLSLFLSVALLACAVQPAAGADAELRACWLTHYAYLGRSEAQLRDIARDIKSGGMNTVYVAMYAGQTVYWPSKAYRAAGGNWGSTNVDYAERLTRIFHEEGLKVGAWFEYGLAVGYNTHPIALQHPDWLARDRFGNPVTGENSGFVFLSPAHPDATQMIVDMVRELAENYSFDDIQIDRFRWGRKFDGREYGYEDATRQRYVATFGENPPNNVNDAQWVRFREELVNDLVARAYATVKQANPEITVSTAPTGAYGIEQHMQRWSDWVIGGYIDVVMPQMYKTTFDAFVNEFHTQVAQAPNHLDKLAVGYRASETDDWQLVADQLDYARNFGIPHASLWVYHYYTSQPAIRDEIDHLPLPGQPWAQDAYNPFVSDRMLQIVIDNDDGWPAYQENGSWLTSAQPDFFRFDSRVSNSASAGATFSAAIPKAGRYDVHVWHTASFNRNPRALFRIAHFNDLTAHEIDQRGNGGEWVHLGRYVFDEQSFGPLITLAGTHLQAGQYTSSDAVKLVLSGYALGDADGDGTVSGADWQIFDACDAAGTPSTGAPCEAFDFDDDGTIDLADVASMQRRAG